MSNWDFNNYLRAVFNTTLYSRKVIIVRGRRQGQTMVSKLLRDYYNELWG